MSNAQTRETHPTNSCTLDKDTLKWLWRQAPVQRSLLLYFVVANDGVIRCKLCGDTIDKHDARGASGNLEEPLATRHRAEVAPVVRALSNLESIFRYGLRDANELMLAITEVANLMEDLTLLSDGDVFPPGKILPLVNRDEFTAALVEAKADVDLPFPDDNRRPLTIGFAVGMGYGKSRLLQEAGNLLNCDVQVYVTYNQELALDAEDPSVGIYLRILTALAFHYRPETAAKRRACVAALETHTPFIMVETALTALVLQTASQVGKKRLPSLTAPTLLRFIVETLAERGTKSYIAVDDLFRLDESGGYPHSDTVISALRSLKRTCNEHHVDVTFIQSALLPDTFKDYRGLQVRWMRCQTLVPDENLVGVAADDLINKDAPEKEKPLRRDGLAYFAGRHMRSVMYLIEWLVANPTDDECSIASFSERMLQVLSTRLHQVDPNDVVQYIVAGLKQSPYVTPAHVARCVGPHGELPLPYVAGNPKLRNLLKSVALGQPTKLLGIAFRSLDLFKAEQSLSAHPKIHVTQVRVPKTGLRFPPGMELCEDVDVFKQVNQVTKVVHLPQAGKYYHPAAINHPLVDRTALAYDETSVEYLILYRDKIDNSEATACLVEAMKLLREEYKKRSLACPTFVCVLTVPSTTTDRWRCLQRLRDAGAFGWVIGHDDMGGVFTPTLVRVVQYLLRGDER